MSLYTQAQYDAIKAAIASGVTTVSYQGKTVTYRDFTEMLTILSMIEAELSGVKVKRQFRPVTWKHL